MLFHFLNFSQCVCLGIKRSTNLKVHSKGRYIVFFFFFISSRTTTNGSFGLQICFPVFVTSQIVNPATWLSTARFEIETQYGCFYITVFLMDANCFQKILDVIFISSCM